MLLIFTFSFLQNFAKSIKSKIFFTTVLIFCNLLASFAKSEDFVNKWKTVGPFEYSSSCIRSTRTGVSIFNNRHVNELQLVENSDSTNYRLLRDSDFMNGRLVFPRGGFSIYVDGKRDEVSLLIARNLGGCSFAFRAASGQKFKILKTKNAPVNTAGSRVDKWINDEVKKCNKEIERSGENIRLGCEKPIYVGLPQPTEGRVVSYGPEVVVPTQVLRLPLSIGDAEFVLVAYGKTAEVW